MAIYDIKNLTFTYSGQNCPSLKGVNFELQEGGFYVICGKSGSGKSTLLRLLKKEVAPNGEILGEVNYCGQSLRSLDGKKSAAEIAFVFQDIDSQLVCDKVWKELAFGLGNLGYKDEYIASKVAEVAEYFGISKWYDKKISELSGGSKQIVAIAAVMTTNPKVLLLDEPTSMLDPIAKKNLANLLVRINSELGVTIVVVEHNTDSVFSFASKVIVLDGGEVVANVAPSDLPSCMRGKDYAKYVGLPEFAELFVRLGKTDDLPQTFVEKKNFLHNLLAARDDSNCKERPPIKSCEQDNKDIVLQAKDIWFRYDKKGADVVCGANFVLHKDEIVCIVGGNGGGKTTFANILAGVYKPYSGKVKKGSTYRVAMLPQNAKGLFVESCVQEEMLVLAKLLKVEKSLAESLMKKFELEGIAHLHPYDVSGGEVQRLALAKLFLTNPDVIILDEPTQGMDIAAKDYLKVFLREQTAQGKSVIIITHDLKFASEIGDRIGLFFDGKISSLSSKQEFFGNNFLYTTECSLLTRDMCYGLSNVDEVVDFLK